MALSESELVEFVDRVREQRADSRRAVQLRVVEPLLELLGWDVRSPAVEPDVALGEQRIDYLLSVDDTPVVAVQTAPPDAGLDDVAASVAEAIAGAGVSWGLLTDGQRYVLLALTDDGVRRRRVELAALPEHREALAAFTHEARSSAIGTAARRAAYRRLSENRDAAIDGVTAALVDVAGDAIEAELRESATRLVDHLVERAPGSVEPGGERPRSAEPAGDADRQRDDQPPASASESGPARADTARSNAENDGAAEVDAEQSGVADEATADGVPTAEQPSSSQSREAAPDDGEYVVRFFGGSSSVGAVGTNSPGGTLVGAVEFLYENHDLGRAVTLPWGVDDGRALLASVPEHPSGAAMEPRASVHDCYVWTGASLDRARAGIEELADAVGLRVMFQGDW